ncbi:MAG: hypothetical protein J6X33_02710 [Clostridiales bacterium]|nr:hypothetical protein [Clostridiales bacterium]
MAKKSRIITMIVSIAVIILLAIATGLKNNDQTKSISVPVTVKNNKVEKSLMEPLYFNPVGENCSYTIDIQGPDALVSNIKIMTASFNSETVYTGQSGNSTVKTGDLTVFDNGMLVLFDPEVKEGATIEDSEYTIRYGIILDSNGNSFWTISMLVIVTLFFIAGCVGMSFLANRNVDRDYDERQVKARGTAAFNSMLITILVALALPTLSTLTGKEPFEPFEYGIIVCLSGILVFIMQADLNDAFVGMKEKRMPLAIIYTVVGLIEILVSIVECVMAKSNVQLYTMISGIFFLAMGIEMIVKAILDKKEAMADEES